VGECVALTASLTDSESGAAALAPYDVDAGLSATPAASFFDSATCVTRASTVTIPTGMSSAPTFFSAPAAGSYVIGVGHVDFLTDGGLVVVVRAATSDAGPPDSGDAGTVVDSGTAVDAGIAVDAGSAVDGGPIDGATGSDDGGAANGDAGRGALSGLRGWSCGCPGAGALVVGSLPLLASRRRRRAVPR
jgi:hypothetical protein